MNKRTRRNFLKTIPLLAAMPPHIIQALEWPPDAPLQKNDYRAAAIGSTGNGGFGHGLDTVFCGLPGVEYVAIADDNAEGLESAGEKCGVDKLYTDYREMLTIENPDIVSVAMRQPVWHEDIVIACAESGAHIFCEKPLAPDLASADRMLEACKSNGVKIAMALQNRASLQVHSAMEMIENGAIGDILTMRGRGKEDHRGGGEDLMVLGYHILDMMRIFCGNPLTVYADVDHDGRDMVLSDAHEATEPMGPVAGSRIAAMYEFPDGVHGYFESHRGLTHPDERFNLEIYGSEGIITLRSVHDVMYLGHPVFNPANEISLQWERVTTDRWEELDDPFHWCNRQLVRGLLHAAEEDTEPWASGDDGRWALEMILGIYASHLAGKPVSLPLEQRTHPLQQ